MFGYFLKVSDRKLSALKPPRPLSVTPTPLTPRFADVVLLVGEDFLGHEKTAAVAAEHAVVAGYRDTDDEAIVAQPLPAKFSVIAAGH